MTGDSRVLMMECSEVGEEEGERGYLERERERQRQVRSSEQGFIASWHWSSDIINRLTAFGLLRLLLCIYSSAIYSTHTLHHGRRSCTATPGAGSP